MSTKLPIWDQRMFELMEICLADPLMGQAESMDFFKTIGITGAATISQIKNNKQSFRLKHFYNASKLYGVSMDWFMGFSGIIYRTDSKPSPLFLLKAATKLIEQELNGKRAVNTTVNTGAKRG